MARTTRAAAAKAAQTIKEEPQQLSSPPQTPAPASKSRSTRVKSEMSSPKTPASSAKRSKRGIKKEEEEGEDESELPHNLGTAMPTPGADEERYESPPNKKAKLSGKGKKLDVSSEETATDGTAIKPEAEAEGETPKKSPKKKDNYGLTPGISPYPDYPRPTPEECHEVVRLLSKVHGEVQAPRAIPPPSLDVAGCGEVPSVLDALIRTRLSANTTNKNSSTAFQGLVSRFGTLKEGVGKGSVDWDAVRRAPQREVFKAIERGGLADRKSRDIQAILQIAYEENQARKEAFTSSGNDTNASAAAGAAREPASEKNAEITKASQNVISLDHLHLLDTNAAIEKMLTLPGIGPKTASCVALFCLQRPSFAVDTHVFRLCQYLGWVPKTTKKNQPKVDRNSTFSHCDVRIPDQLKYPLHALLIRHGKVCPRCRAVTGLESKGWELGCPIEHLVKRHGGRKGGGSVKDRERAAGLAAGVGDEGGEAEGEDGEDGDDGEYVEN